MTWTDKLVLWKNDVVNPMTHTDVDTSYAIDRLDWGRRFIYGTKFDLKNKKVLDMAVGCGGILAAFAESGAKCYGLDVNDYFLEITKARFEDMHLECESLNKWKGGGFNIPYPDDFFDFVICTDTLHHSPNNRKMISEMSRVMKWGAKIFISEERRWFPLYVLKSPHDNMPLTVLMPKPIRIFFERLKKLPPLQEYMYSFSFELKNAFANEGIWLKEIDFLKRQTFEKNNFPEFLWKFYNLMFMQYIGEKKLPVLEKVPWDVIPP